MLNKLLLWAVCLLAGCSTLPKSNVEIPASLMTKCQPLSKLEGTSGADMLKNIVSNAELYYKCSDAHDKLVEVVKPVK